MFELAPAQSAFTIKISESIFAPEQIRYYVLLPSLIKPNDSTFSDLRPRAEDLRPKSGDTPAQISLIKKKKKTFVTEKLECARWFLKPYRI